MDVINCHLSDETQKHLEDDEKPFSATGIELDVAEDIAENVRTILGKHERLWTRNLHQINATDMRIDLVPDTKPFVSPPYLAGPKTPQLEKNLINM